MYNKKPLREAIKNLDRTVAPAKKKDMIVDPMGQWKYPGQNTRIPSNNITMQGVPYPVWAVPNVGTPQMMYPEQDYYFPGADHVDEYPQVAQRGGDISIPQLNQYEDGGEYDLTQEEIDDLIAQGYEIEDVETDKYKKGGILKLPNKKKSWLYSRSLSARNKLFLPNNLTASRKWRIFDPEAKYLQEGGPADTIIYPPGDSEYLNQPPLNFDIIEKEDYEYRKGYDDYLEFLRYQPKKKTPEYYMDEPLRLAQDGGVSPLEGNYISNVIMNRNRGTDFVDRAYALGANPGTPLFNVPDDEQFGAHMSHKMAYGEGEAGKTWMFPTVLNPKDEAIEVPGQYADYISSEGYKYATGMKQKGGFQDDLGKHRKLLRDWTYGASIGMLHKAQDGESVIQSVTPWKGAPGVTGDIMTPPVIFEGKDVTVKAEAPKWARYQKEYQNANPWDRYLAGEKNKYIRKNKGLNKAAGVTADNFPKDAEERIRQEYDRKMNTYTTRKLGKLFGFNPRKRGEWVDLLIPKEKEIVANSKYGSKLKPDAWSRFMSGARSIYNAIPVAPDIVKQIPGYTEAENKAALKNYTEGFEILAPLDVPGIVIANKMKNMNAENPSLYSGEMMGNVDYGDVIAMNPLTIPDMYGLSVGAVQLGRGIAKGSKSIGKRLAEVPNSPNTFTKSGLGGMDMSRYEIKNPDYFDQLLKTYDNKSLSPSNKKFYRDLINTVKKQNGLATERQYNELQRLKTGNFNFGKKAYQEGGEAEYEDLDLTPQEIDWYLANGYEIEDLGEAE